MAEERPPSRGALARAAIRGQVSRRLPPGSPGRRAALVALESFRTTKRSVVHVEGFRRDLAVSHQTPFAYRRWLDVQGDTAIDADAIERAAAQRNRSRLHVAVLPGEGPSVVTTSSLDAQLRPVDGHHRIHPGGEAEELAALVRDLADQDFLVLLRRGDRLEPDAVARILDRADADPRAIAVTWDDDVDGPDGPTDPRFHPPTFSPDRLLSAWPHGRSIAVRADAVRDAGGIDPSVGDDALWDLVLRMDPGESDVVHVPRVLVHLHDRPADAGPAATDVVAAHLDRLGLEGTPVRRQGAVHVRWRPAERPRVSVVVPTRHNEAMAGPLLDSLARTEYPDWELVVVDNGGRTPEHERFWEERAGGIDHRVLWWDRPFNYGAVNNLAVAESTGQVVVLLNDDTVVHSPDWLDELVGWLSVPGVGSVGVQLVDPDGLIQHGGAIIGAGGMADHRFQGMWPHSRTLIGSTDWYWDSSANTAACVALTRELWDDVGGLDERFELCGSDVVLGLDVRRRGLRNVCTPAIRIDHMESATRLTDVPVGDVFASYWRYSRFLRNGDPYANPNVSLMSREPALRAPDEPTALARVGPALGRGFGGAFVQSASAAEAWAFGDACRADSATVARIVEQHRANAGPIELGTVNWFVPDFDNPFYGGLATIFRIADHLRRHHDVTNRFVVWGEPNERWFRSGLAAVFPGLEASEVTYCPLLDADSVADLPAADVSIATQWQTAYQVAHFPHTRRRFYLVQDFEPMFNPAGTLYALAEETYKLGLQALCNTDHLLDVVRDRYGMAGTSFTPAVDDRVFHARGRPERAPGDPVTVFVYARPGHWRNCWELLLPALREVKRRFGRGVKIVTAGAWADKDSLADGLDHLGLLDYVETGDLYRTCDVGVSLTVSEHPSYLPLELMACGVPVVAFDLPAGYWILRDGENSLLAQRTIDGLVERIDAMVRDEGLRRRLSEGGLASIAAAHADWEANLAGIATALSGPLEGSGTGPGEG